MESPSTPFMPTRRQTLAGILGISIGAALTACGAGSDSGKSDSSGSSSGSDAFPVTIKHAFGSTTIEKKPERVLPYAYGSLDAVLALGVVPVAMPFQAFGGDANGIRPWIHDALAKLGAKTPPVMKNSSEPSYEEIAAAAPDIILATYSGITKEQYDKLSKIAPVIAYPTTIWTTPWREVITTTGLALGLKDKSKEILDGISTKMAQTAAAHPDFKGTSIAVVSPAPDAFYVYTDKESRVEFTLDLSFVSAPSVKALYNGNDPSTYTISLERVGDLTSDILITYFSTQQEANAFMAAPYAQNMSQVKSGAVANVIGDELIAAIAPPTALSFGWGVDKYATILAGATAKAKA